MAKIDKALAAGPDLGDEQVAEVKRLRGEGERLHETGGHSQSMDTHSGHRRFNIHPT